MEQLRRYLESIQPGPVPDPTQLEYVLADAWRQFDGNRAEAMTGRKLIGRMEDVVWAPPLLTFKIERHGGTALGSTRAERHRWTLDIAQRTADVERAGFRQVHRMAHRVDVKPIARELVDLISRAETADERLKWYKDGTVRVQVATIFPKGSAVSQTLKGRRDRLREAVDAALKEHGWAEVTRDVYGRMTQEASA